MPGIRINFEFDVDLFKQITNKPNSNHLEMEATIEFALESFQTAISGNTTIGGLRCSLYEAIHTANADLFQFVKGVDLWFNSRLLSNDSDIMIDITGLWHNSTITVKPTKSILEFTDAFFHHGILTTNKLCVRCMVLNALNESVQCKDVKRWDSFCAEMLRFWSENKNENAFQHAEIFTHFLLKFDPSPLRSFCGWKLLNVVMGTSMSVSILKQLLIEEDILFSTDAHGTTVLMHTILENDLKAMDHILDFGVDLHAQIDDVNDVYDFAMIYGSMEMSSKLEDYQQILCLKRRVIQTHSTFIENNVPTDIINEIGEFLLGLDVMHHHKQCTQMDLFQELENSVTQTKPISPTISDSVEMISSRFRCLSSANELFEIEERNSLSVCSR